MNGADVQTPLVTSEPPPLQCAVPSWERSSRILNVQVPETWGHATENDIRTFEADEEGEFFSPYAFRREVTLRRRRRLFQAMQRSYPNKIPIIVAVAAASRSSIELQKERYLVPHAMTIGAFMQKLREHLCGNGFSASTSLFLFTENGAAPVISASVGNVWERYRSQDDYFLYLGVGVESTFGAFEFL